MNIRKIKFKIICFGLILVLAIKKINLNFSVKHRKQIIKFLLNINKIIILINKIIQIIPIIPILNTSNKKKINSKFKMWIINKKIEIANNLYVKIVNKCNELNNKINNINIKYNELCDKINNIDVKYNELYNKIDNIDKIKLNSNSNCKCECEYEFKCKCKCNCERNIITINDNFIFSNENLYNASFVICNRTNKITFITLPSKCDAKLIGSVIFIKNFSDYNLILTSTNTIFYSNTNANEYCIRPKNYAIFSLIDESTYVIF